MTLEKTAPAFVEMAHRIVWASAATVDPQGKPRARIFHPIWQWDGARLTGWVATRPTALKRAHLAAHPYMSINYWSPTQDTCVAECRAELVFDQPTRTMLWELFSNTPGPLGYDPRIIPGWTSAESESFAAVRLDPWLLRVMPGSVLAGKGEILKWQES